MPADIIHTGSEIYVNMANEAVGSTKSDAAGMLGYTALMTSCAAAFLAGFAL